VNRCTSAAPGCGQSKRDAPDGSLEGAHLIDGELAEDKILIAGSCGGRPGMITKKRTGRGARVKVTFRLPSGDRQVAVAGDFNGWDPTATPMRKRGDTRSASVNLDPGRRYSFRYVDEHGRWFNDDLADEFEGNDFGESNSIIDLTDQQ
jgi:hypothetical protein